MTRTNESRIAGLDALRGIAALAVVLFHFTNKHADLPGLAMPAWGSWFRYGHHGVELFFVISGYVMLMSVERAATPWRFIVGRFERLMPTFWAGTTITFLAILALGLGPRAVSVSDWLVGLTMQTEALNLVFRRDPPWRIVDGVYWTLTVEWFFYFLIFGVRLIGGIGREKVWCVLWIATIVLLSKLDGPWIIQALLGAKWAPYLATGVVIARMQQGKISRSLGSVILLGFGICAGVVSGAEAWWIWVIATAAVAWATSNGNSALALRPLLWLGGISYPLYLIHQNVGLSVLNRMQQKGIAWEASFGVAIVSTFAIAWILHETVELKVANWIKQRRSR